MKNKMTIYSSKSMKDLCERMERLVDRIEEKENRSMARSTWNFMSKKPIIGKESVTKKIMRKFKKG